MGTPGPETKLVQNIVKAIRREYPDAFVTKVHGGPYQSAGLPDLFVVVEGFFLGIEVKAQRPGESREHAFSRVTDRQDEVLHQIVRAGAVGVVALSVEDALLAIRHALSHVA